MADELWIPLVDEPIGAIVTRVLAELPDVERSMDTPRRVVAFRVLAYIRIGILFGELMMENDWSLAKVDDSWSEAFLQDPRYHEAVATELRAVATEILADPAHAGGEAVGPDEAARERFRRFARERIG